MDAVVNEFPAPPSHWKTFRDTDQALPPPAIPPLVETYGGSIPFPPSETLNEKKCAHHLPQQLQEFVPAPPPSPSSLPRPPLVTSADLLLARRLIAEFMRQALLFVSDVNRREPVENGVANLEILIHKIYEKISQYRHHEASPPPLSDPLTSLTVLSCRLVRISVSS